MMDSPFLCHSQCRSPLAGLTDLPPSPIPYLLGTNRAPSDSETQNIRASIAALQPNISRLDADIAHARRVLAQLVREREALQSYVNEHATFLSPARRMPADIWSEIFWHCLPTTTEIWDEQLKGLDLIEHATYSPNTAPSLLLRVCRDWRAIALSSPRLWSLITQPCDFPLITLFETWLMRSQHASLSVIIENSPSAISFFQSSPARVMLEQSYRWRVLDISLWSTWMYALFPLRNSLPGLEELHLRFSVWSSQEEVDLFWNTPKLRRVTIHRTPYPIVNLKLPWAQLTQFSLKEEQSIIALCTLLQSAPNLLEVDWLLSQPMGSPCYPSMVVQHHRLRDLSVSMFSDPRSSFDYLSLPSLSKLSIQVETYGRRSKALSWILFELFMSRSGRALENLQLNVDFTEVSDLVAGLKSLPVLSDLSLFVRNSTTDTADIEELLRSLSYTSASTDAVMLPALRTIKIGCVINAQVGWSVRREFINMVESRWHASHIFHHSRQVKSISQPHNSPMRSASLTIHGLHDLTISQADQTRLRRLRAEGLLVQVLFIHKSDPPSPVTDWPL